MNLSDQLSLTAKENLTKTAYIFNDEETSYREIGRCCNEICI